MRVICLNGAPRAGKDTVAMLIKGIVESSDLNATVYIQKFASPLDQIARAVLGIYSVDKYQELRELQKDEPLSVFGTDKTMRDLLIAISEDLIKPIFSEEYFANKAAEAVKQTLQIVKDLHNDVMVFTDCGFQKEFDSFKAQLSSIGVEPILVNVTREGKNFDNDSREHVTDEGNSYLISNNGGLKDLKHSVENILELQGIEVDV